MSTGTGSSLLKQTRVVGRMLYFVSVRYLAGVVIVEPALQVDGVPAWHQTAILENSQFDRRVVACRDDIVERVLQCHWVIVGSLVLLAGRRRGGNENGGTATERLREGADREMERTNPAFWRQTWYQE